MGGGCLAETRGDFQPLGPSMMMPQCRHFLQAAQRRPGVPGTSWRQATISSRSSPRSRLQATRQQKCQRQQAVLLSCRAESQLSEYAVGNFASRRS